MCFPSATSFCRVAAAALGRDPSSISENNPPSADARPGGCFWDQNEGGYFNSDLEGEPNWAGVGGLCREPYVAPSGVRDHYPGGQCVQSPNYPNPYPATSSCSIRATFGDGITSALAFEYFETSPGDAQKALHAQRLPLTTPEFERQASTSPLPSPEVTAKVLDTVVEMSNDELVAAVRAEAVRRASSTEEAAASASDDDAPPRAVSPTLEAARPVSPIMSPAQTPAAVDVVDAPPPAVDAIRPIPDAVDAAPPPLVSRAASTKTATPQGHLSLIHI